MLEGKTALISGASRGIGKQIALTFAEHGAFVGINYVLNDTEAKKTLQTIEMNGHKGMLLKGDISIDTHVDQIVTKLVKKRKRIDILVNNAGIYFRNQFINISRQAWEKVLSVNLTGCYHLCKYTIPHMKSNGKILFISSQLAYKGSSHGANYATSKAGMLGLMRSLALELAEKNIYVNAIAPGTIDTDIIAGYTKKMRDERIKEIPLKRLGMPKDVANCCLFLASDLSNYITGETIHVNGGLYIH
jgi:3-oxoacyl-[acyl-carrier protein] reductase